MFTVDRNKVFVGDHRKDIGGQWKPIGKLQFDFLIKKGLKPEHTLMDLACGSLRLGVHAIPYCNYMGVDACEELIQAGIRLELGLVNYAKYTPHFYITETFDFSNIFYKPDYVIAQSLFTHLTEDDCRKCVESLFNYVKDTTKIFITFFEIDAEHQNPELSERHDCFYYTKEQIMSILSPFYVNYIGDWNHPRNQIIVECRKEMPNV